MSQHDLVADMSHDLKTPLTSIQGFSQALLDGMAQDDASRQRPASIIYEEAERMRRLVQSLLELARLERGQETLRREPVDLAALLRTRRARFAPQSEQLGLELVLELDSSLRSVVGDPDRLTQVFSSLLDNASRHAGGAHRDARVVVTAEQREDSVVCTVTDNGPRIASQDLPRIFDRFYQVDKSRPGDRISAGLGLAIAREIVLAHGGQIHAESIEGLGSQFVVVLPS